MKTVTIRRAGMEDLVSITKLWSEMMDHHLAVDPRFSLIPDREQAYQEYVLSILNNFDYGVFVAVDEGRIIAYTIGMILTNPPVFSLERYGFISEMAVSEASQRGGIGEQLWKHAQRWFHRRGITVIQLNVSPKNERGYNFWKKVGCDEFLTIMWHDIPKKLS